MKSALNAFVLLLTLAALAIIVAYMAQNPIPVALQWGPNTVLTTQAYVVVALGALVAVFLFYMGQGVAWLTHLPQHVAQTRDKARHEAFLNTLATALLALAEGRPKEALRQAKRLPQPASPMGIEAALTHLVALQNGLLEGAEAEAALTNPLSGALVATTMARTAATHANWAEVRRITHLGLALSPENAPLLTLHFKALVNINDPAVEMFLPRLKPLLGPTAFKLLSSLILGLNSTQARQLDHAWVKAFQAWLPTASETFPTFHTEGPL